MPDIQVANDNFNGTERRFLLFQVDLGNRNLNTVLGARSLSDTRQPQESVRISDPVDYDNPASPLYWRKINQMQDSEGNNVYAAELRQQFTLFMSQFQAAINDKTIKLKGTDEKHPYIDVSDFVKGVEDYSVRLDGLSNKLNIVLARPESTDMVSGKQAEAGEILVNFNDDVLGTLNPNENDIIVVKAAFGADQNFEPEYIGLITKVNKSFSNGKIDSFSLEVFGLSKILYTSQMIKNKSARPNEFIPGIELNDRAMNTPYSHNFDKKNIREVFKYILDDSLACKEIDKNALSFLYRLDPSVFVTFEKFGFQHNIFVLLALYLMSVTEAPPATEGTLDARLFPQEKPAGLDSLVIGFNTDAASSVTVPILPRTAKRPVLDFFVRGVLEYGDHNRAYNRMARQGVEHFFSEMTKPADILGEVRSSSYTDIFESRDGVIVCRPPRFNKVEITNSEWSRTSAEDNPKSLLQLTPEQVWEFNPDSQFVIRSEETVNIPDIAKDEMALESRIDIKAIFPMRGAIDYPTALYVDPDILFRYGLRTHGAVTNPNAYNKKLARLFAPIALAMVNAPTRTLNITVKDGRKFYVGKLYYLEAIDMVGFLAQDTINHGHAAHSTRTLSFTMLRKVVRRPISEIMNSDDEILNVGMMFTTDFPNQEGLDAMIADGGFEFQSPKGIPNKPTVKNLMYTKGKLFLESILKLVPPLSPRFFERGEGLHRTRDEAVENGKRSAASTKLVMFKYIPGIEDLILEVESNPQIVEPPTEANQNIANATRIAKNERLRVLMDPSNFLYYTAGFKNGVEQSGDERLRFVQSILNISTNSIEEGHIDLRTPSLTKPINIDYTGDSKAPMSMAGLLNYVFPTIPLPGKITRLSPFIEVPGSSPIYFMKSPFIADALSTPPQNLALSQPLMNRLVDFDLNMKFDITTAIVFGKITMNSSGIQQYYYLNGDTFVLFGSNRTPKNYLENLVISGEREDFTVSNFQTSILESVGCLKLNKEMTAFENEFFSIPVRAGAFDLPFGHLVLKQGAKPGQMGFYKVFSSTASREGGRFNVSAGTLSNEFLVKPLTDSSQIEDANGGSATIGRGGILSVASADGLYFMSPFLEPTIERLLDIWIPPKFGGNLTASEAEKQKKLSSKGGLTSQAERQNGRAINVSIDALLLASKGNIQVKGGARPGATTPLGSGSVPPLYRRFEQQGLRAFKSGSIRPIPNALESDLLLPDGTNLGKRQLMIYTLFIYSDSEGVYASKLQSNGDAASVGA